MRVILYTDVEEVDLTQWVKNISLTKSILEPYDNARLDLAIPYELEVLPSVSATGAIDLDSWIVIYHQGREDSRERAVFLGCLAGVTSGFYAVTGGELEGGVRARDVSLRCESWLKVMRAGQIYLSGKTELVGHVLDIDQFGERFRQLGALPFKSRNVGDALRGFWTELAQHYRLPERLTGSSLGFEVSVISDEETAQRDAPERAPYQKGVYGLALNAVSGALGGSGATAWGIIRSVFSGEANMIELFPSLEPTDTEESDLSKKLGARPVLIYRLKPFTFSDYHTEKDSALRQVENTSSASRVARVLFSNDVLSVDLSQSDSDRINGVYVHTPLTPSRGVELFGLAGEPHFNEDDIDRQGLRLFRGQWPFFPQGKRRATAEGYGVEIQNIIDLATAITEDDHRYLNGTLQTRARLDIQAGEWVKVDLSPHKERALVCYVETVSSNITVREDGVIIQRSTLEFTRGFYD